MSSKIKDEILTIPNILSMFRILLIPVFVWLYIIQEDYLYAAVILVLSGITDILDGFIARKFNLITRLGKILDPIADKLTQAVVLLCLTDRYPLMALPLIVLVVKEVVTGLGGLLVIRESGRVYGSDWHGKVSTALLYVMMVVHVLWFNIPAETSKLFILSSLVMMLLSFSLYTFQNIRIIQDTKRREKEERE